MRQQGPRTKKRRIPGFLFSGTWTKRQANFPDQNGMGGWIMGPEVITKTRKGPYLMKKYKKIRQENSTKKCVIGQSAGHTGLGGGAPVLVFYFLRIS